MNFSTNRTCSTVWKPSGPNADLNTFCRFCKLWHRNREGSGDISFTKRSSVSVLKLMKQIKFEVFFNDAIRRYYSALSTPASYSIVSDIRSCFKICPETVWVVFLSVSLNLCIKMIIYQNKLIIIILKQCFVLFMQQWWQDLYFSVFLLLFLYFTVNQWCFSSDAVSHAFLWDHINVCFPTFEQQDCHFCHLFRNVQKVWNSRVKLVHQQ